MSSLIDTSNVTQAILVGEANAASMTVNGWSGDATVDLGPSTSASLYALSGATGNSFQGHPTTSTLSGPGYSYTTNGAGTVTAFGNGGSDTAAIDDQGSSGNAELLGYLGYIAGSGYHVEADSFPSLSATSHNSADSAVLSDPSWGGSDTGVMHPTYSSMTGGGYADYVYGYTTVEMRAQYNSDAAFLDDVNSSGTAHSHAQSSSFQGSGYSNTADSFGHLQLLSYSSSDVAYMDDSGASGGSNFYSNPSNSYWQGTASGAGFVNNAVAFKTIYSVAENGSDYAWYSDSAGGS